jgi:hypothetical protein
MVVRLVERPDHDDEIRKDSTARCLAANRSSEPNRGLASAQKPSDSCRSGQRQRREIRLNASSDPMIATTTLSTTSTG